MAAVSNCVQADWEEPEVLVVTIVNEPQAPPPLDDGDQLLVSFTKFLSSSLPMIVPEVLQDLCRQYQVNRRNSQPRDQLQDNVEDENTNARQGNSTHTHRSSTRPSTVQQSNAPGPSRSSAARYPQGPPVPPVVLYTENNSLYQPCTNSPNVGDQDVDESLIAGYAVSGEFEMMPIVHQDLGDQALGYQDLNDQDLNDQDLGFPDLGGWGGEGGYIYRPAV